MFIAPLKKDRWGVGRKRPAMSKPAAMVTALLLLSFVFLVSLIVMLVEFV